MITLDIQKYCHDCPDFEADVSKRTIHGFDDALEWTDTKISCAHKNRCYEIKKYIEKNRS